MEHATKAKSHDAALVLAEVRALGRRENQISPR